MNVQYFEQNFRITLAHLIERDLQKNSKESATKWCTIVLMKYTENERG